MNLKEFDEFRLSDAISYHNKLNPALFNNTVLDSDVRESLLIIAQDFMDHLGVNDIDIKDITLSGSNAAYTYTPHSDIDLHLVVDIDKLKNDEIYRELFNSKKVLYNDSHDIKIHGYDVELYVQDSSELTKTLGEYSILKNKWIKFPSKRKANFDEHSASEKFKKLIQLIELSLKSDDLKKLDNLLATIKKYRQAGLNKHGEFGPENLAYKALRSKGIIDQLYKHRDKIHSVNLSIDEYTEPVSYQLENELEDKLSSELSEFMSNEDYHPNEKPPGPEFKPTMPKGTVRVDVSDVYDWYKLGQHISNLKGLGKHDFGKGPPSTILSFGDEDTEHKYIKDLEKTGLTTTDIDPVDPTQPKSMKRQKVDSTFNVSEASGYIPSEKEKNDPRFKTALTVDVTPNSIKDNVKKLGLGKISRAGIPNTLRKDGKT